MKGILLDTNVVSETARAEPDKSVLAFLYHQRDLWLSSIVLHELEFGLQLLPLGRRRDRIAAAVRSLAAENASRILPIGVKEAEQAATFRAQARRSGRTLDLGDSLISATAAVHGLIIATRNVKDFKGLDIQVINPWSRRSGS